MRILIVEDEKKIRDFLEMILKPDFSIDTAKDGEAGSHMARTNDYDLVLLDNALPYKQGKEVCEEIRAAKKTVPILVLSALGETHNKVELLNAGADDYLTKPFSSDELLARTRALLRRPRHLEQEVLSAGNITLNTQTHEVFCNNESVKLTRKEFMLLQYFLRNKGIVLSRGMIMDHVWDMSTDLFSNTIEAHIVSLRKKINDKKQSIIKTVSGRGYKIIEPKEDILAKSK